MIGTIRRHSKILWAIIIFCTVVAFVVFFTPDVRLGGLGGDREADLGSLNGRSITRDEFVAAYRETMLVHLFNYRSWPDKPNRRSMGFDIERETRNRLLLLHKAAELNIQVSDDAVKQWIADSPAFRQRDQSTFSPEAYEGFLKNMLPEAGLTTADFQRYVRNELAVQQLIALAGLTGKLISPREAELLYRQENEKVEALAVIFQSSSQLTNVTLDPAAVAQFYTNRQSAYRIPEKVVVSYVKFDATNYFAEVDAKLAQEVTLTNLIDALYVQRGPSAFVDTNGQVLSATAAKARILEEHRKKEALVLARKQASKFATELQELTPRKLENIDNLAAAEGLLVSVTTPFSERERPLGVNTPEAFVRTAFKLTEEEPFSSGIVGADAVFVIGLKQRIPSEIPPFENVRARVEIEFKNQKAVELAQEAGEAFAAKMTNALAEGKTFEAFCAEENVAPVKLPPFSQQSYSLPGETRLNISTVKDVANTLAVGKTSGFTQTPQGGFLLHVKARTPVEEEQMKKELPEFVKRLRQSRYYAAFGEWVRKERELARLTEPAKAQVELE
jgi:peptidyl-prolyl cis-trans isomerase D